MAERKQVNVLVDADTKEEWQRAAKENPEYNSLSHLIKLAVAHELNGGRGDSDSVDTETLGHLQETVENLRDDVDGLRDDVRTVTKEQQKNVPDTDRRTEIWGELPIIPVEGYDRENPQTEVESKAVTVDDIQNRLPHYSKDQIRTTLRDLAEDTKLMGIVSGGEMGMTQHYFREG